VSAAVITIVLNYALIPVIGYLGSAITTLVVYIYMCVFAYITGQKYYPIKYDIGKLSFYLGLTLILLLIGWNINIENIYVSQILKELLILVFIAIAYIRERKKLQLN
jgi:O-antigen/teichoic acid export membrane protein